MTDRPRDTRLIALDWGSTRLRAYRLGPAGAVLDARSSADGASRIRDGAPAFEAALHAVAGDWLLAAPDVPIVACGMVGSAHGWHEAAYCPCPATAGDVAHQAVRVPLSEALPQRPADGPTRGASQESTQPRYVILVPGVSHRPAGAPPDVMRGEETQVFGALAGMPALTGDAWFVLPGTHSKWVRVENGRIERFHTAMTGELFALLRDHSVLARSIAAEAAPDPVAFQRGVRAAAEAAVPDLARQLFGVRAMSLFGELKPDAAGEYLSGLLVGQEVRAGLATSDLSSAREFVLVGDPALCARYDQALAVFGARGVTAARDAAARGLWRIAVAAGWVN